MTNAQKMRFMAAIEKRRRELAREIQARTPDLTVEEEHDPLDRVQSMNQRDEAAIRLGKLSCDLAQMESSLDAIGKGSYGLCLDCGEPISLKRLEILPWALRCRDCQELLERWPTEERKAA